MTNKLYIKLKEILKEDKLIIVLFVFLLLNFVNLPYYINGTGGLVDLEDKIKIENSYKSIGSFNMAYVSEYKANPFILLYALINPNLDIYSKSEYLATNDTNETMSYREDLELKQSFDDAVILGYNLAHHKVAITKNDLYVTYIYEDNTSLKIGDKINKIDNIVINDLSDLREVIQSKNVGDKIKIDVINDDSTYERYAYIKEENGYKMIGIYVTTSKEYETDPKIDFNFKNRESGPSGGLMMTLEIYNELTSQDLTKGHKIAGTGTIDIDGNVGMIGGVKYKLKGAYKKHADIFFVAADNYEEALEYKNKYHYNMEVVSVKTIYDAINYLNDL